MIRQTVVLLLPSYLGGVTMFESFMREAAKLQYEYTKLMRRQKITKRAICDLCVPFRDKYHLKDATVLGIARKEKDLSDIIRIFDTEVSL